MSETRTQESVFDEIKQKGTWWAAGELCRLFRKDQGKTTPPVKALDEGALEAACRILAERHYAERFKADPKSAHIRMNVNANWRLFEIDGRPLLEAYLSALSAQSQESGNAANGNQTHKYEPDNKYPWFCGKCGYAEHEVLQHGQSQRIEQSSRNISTEGEKL